MKKTLLCLTLALSLAFFGTQAIAQDSATTSTTNPAGNPVDQFTGEYWVKSTLQNKEAYLFGIESAIAIEEVINSRLAADVAKTGKKPVFCLSPFEKGWMTAFKNTTRKEMVSEVDAWYNTHPDKLDRPVLGVIWYELIEPRLKGTK